jgi:hypothetical protein
VPPLGFSGDDRGAPGQTRERALPHHGKTDLRADSPPRLRHGTQCGQLHPGGSAAGRWRTREICTCQIDWYRQGRQLTTGVNQAVAERWHGCWRHRVCSWNSRIPHLHGSSERGSRFIDRVSSSQRAWERTVLGPEKHEIDDLSRDSWRGLLPNLIDILYHDVCCAVPTRDAGMCGRSTTNTTLRRFGNAAATC